MMKWMSLFALASAVGFFAVMWLATTPSFDAVDADKDGLLSEFEAAGIPRLDFAKADTNQDGMLSRSEYLAAVG